MHSMNIKRLSSLSEKPLRVVFELEPLDCLSAYAIREMYNYIVFALDTQKSIGGKRKKRPQWGRFGSLQISPRYRAAGQRDGPA